MTCSINIIMIPDFHASQGKKQLDKLQDKLRDIYSDDRIKKVAAIGDNLEP